MRKSFILFYNVELAESFEAITTHLDEIDPECKWYVPMPCCIFFTSVQSPTFISGFLRGRITPVRSGALFLVIEFKTGKTDGFLPFRGWDILNNPDSAPRDPPA